jgi:adenine phosphoribosyltransferase/phosphomevalonate kinase
VLAYTCPLPKALLAPKLILLIMGQSCVGKDYCADVWVSMFAKRSLTPRAMGISEAIKREYAAATGADAGRLLSERAYKEQHRTALTAYLLDRVEHEPQLPEEQFLQVVNEAVDVGVLLITGMRDKAPIAAFSHLVPSSRLVEVYVHASAEKRRSRKGCYLDDSDDASHKMSKPIESSSTLSHKPCLNFDNKMPGNGALNIFFEDHLLPLVHEDLLRLADMVRSTPDFPRQNIIFRHVLGISQQPRGLALCTSLLQSHFTGDWNTVTAIACCEVGGIVFASSLSLQLSIPLMLIREAGKLPPPTFSAVKSQSHVSSMICSKPNQKRVEIERSAVPSSGSIVLVDDTLATGETLSAILQAMKRAGVTVENVSVLVVAEFPIHRGRELLCKRGFAGVSVRSLLSFDGA